MNWYVNWVSQNPLLSAAIQFAILGTFGELLSAVIKGEEILLQFNFIQLVEKIFAWALLGIIIKYGFAGMKGFVRALIEHHLFPQLFSKGIGWAFAVSVCTNIFFGPQMMLFHRIEDDLILWRWNFNGLKTAWFTLIWFWIPAHTVTFSLPKEF